MQPQSYRERLYDAFSAPTGEIDDRIDDALAVGADYLDLPIGFFTRIDDGVQEVVRATGSHDLIQPGETCPLEDAYCRRTIDRDSPLAVQDVAESVIDQTAVDTFGLATYIGAKVVVDGEVYGTICFAAETEREAPFTDAEEVFLELMANLVGGALERRAHERDLRERNRRLEAEKRRFEGIAEASFDILFRVDLVGRFTYVSAAVERILGYEPAALEGEPFTDIMTDRATERARRAYAEVQSGRYEEDLELEFLDSDGEVVILAVNASPITDEGDVVGVQGVGRDVTARKERERELRLKNRAIDEAQVGIAIADTSHPEEPLRYVNRGFERLTGYTSAEVLGRNCRFLQGPATDPETVELFRERIDAGESVEVELINYRKDGSPFWNQVRLTPIGDGTGEEGHYLGFQDDVTERKRTEQLIRILNRVLRHNLRNDMNALLGWAGLDADASQAGPAPETRIRRIARDLVDVSERARDLEQWARSDRVPRRLDPAALLASVIESHREALPVATIDVDVRTDRDVCAGFELERAVSELVDNAISHAVSAAVTVSLTVEDDGEWVVVTVADDGPGIAEMEADVIASGTETALQHGSGLGLWLVNWIVTRYGGSFRIGTAADGSGTTATVRVPGIREDETVDEVARRPTVLFR